MTPLTRDAGAPKWMMVLTFALSIPIPGEFSTWQYFKW